MFIHTFVYNQQNVNIPEYSNYKIWNYQMILDLIQSNYSEWEIFFKRLILNKSRENLIKYIVINEYGGIFINIELLQLFTNDNMKLIQNINVKNNIIFWIGKKIKDLVIDIFDVDNFIINDDIFIIPNKSEQFIQMILQNIDKSIIPQNEYQNKIYLGNVFLSKQLVIYSQTNSTIFDFANILDMNQNYQKLKIELINDFPFDHKYKQKVYPDVPDLSNPEKILNSWENVYTTKKYIENLLIIIFFKNNTPIQTLILICLITIINYYLKEYIRNTLDIKINSAIVDSTAFYYPTKFDFLRKLQKSWKIIRKEALHQMLNSPQLDISRNINDWYNADDYYKQVINKYGWIRSWGDDDKGNYQWYNYGLIYFNHEFNENIKHCPKTYKIIKKMKPYINICGFSWMFGNCVIKPHTDITGITSGSLALHLGLSIPEPNETCKLIIKNNNNEYIYMKEQNGKMIIFDANYEHYAYNLSNQDRLILYLDFKII